jgi:hypothetical protein
MAAIINPATTIPARITILFRGMGVPGFFGTSDSGACIPYFPNLLKL